MPKTGLVRTWVRSVFPEWSSTRMSRWLKINSRTLQRWMIAEEGEIDDDEVPPSMRLQIEAQAQIIEDIGLGERLDEFIESMQKNGVDDEVLAAWLAHRYKLLINREID